MIEPMYKVEHRGFWERVGDAGRTRETGYHHDGVVHENYLGTCIGQFTHLGDNKCWVVYFFGNYEDETIEAKDLVTPVRHICDKHGSSLSYGMRIKRWLFAHRAWIGSVLAGIVGSLFTLAISNAMH